MVTTVADSLFNRLIDAFPADRAYRDDDFSRDPMPGPLRAYLEWRMATHLNEALDPEHAWIDADHPDVRAAAQSFRKALTGHGRIPASKWRGELGLACRAVMSYLVRPVPALTDMVFSDDDDEAEWKEVAERLRHLPAYSYFYDVISAYVEQKGVERVSRERVAGLARRIDHQMVRDFGADEWMTLIDPLLDVVRRIPKYSGGVPADVMKMFLEEKGADDLVARLDAHVWSDGSRLLTAADLRKLFEQPVEEPAEEPDESAETEGVTDEKEPSHRGSHVPLWKQFESGLHPASSRETRSAPASSGDAAPAVSTEPQPLWKQYHGSSRGPSARENEPARGHESERESEPARKNEPARGSASARGSESDRTHETARPIEPAQRSGLLSEKSPRAGAQTDRGIAAKGAGQGDRRPVDLATLERSVLGGRGGRNRDLFLRHLFSGSREAYEDTLRKLDAAASWSEASQIIAREVFLKHQVNIYSDPAVAFTDAAEAKYRS